MVHVGNYDQTGRNMNEKKVDRRVIKTKRAIRNAFAEMLLKKELHEITIKDIADTADINRKTFYSHYTGIYQVVDEIENNIVSDFRDLLCDVDVQSCLKNPYEIFQKLTETINSDIKFYGNLLQMNRNTSLISKIVQELKETLKDSFAEEIRADADSIDVIADFVIAGMLAVYQNWFNSNKKQSISELSKTTSIITTFGVSGFVG
jgi:AcrR family transcriptional regulator